MTTLVSRSFTRAAAVALCTVATVAVTGTALACTAFTLRAQDGAVVVGRTMEWGPFDLKSRIIIVKRGTRFTAPLQNGIKGITWTGKYGAVGLDGFEKPYFTDGMNEKGLAVSSLYHPDFAKYSKYDPSQRTRSMGSADISMYIATNFATVAEVRAAMANIRVVPVIEPALGIAPPVHLLITEPSGKAIVIEFLKGKITIFDAPLGVLTNAPTYDWHMTNLRNYINLSLVALPTKTIDKLDFSPLGVGSGMIGLPGDFTPPSRFVRAVAFTRAARKTKDGPETVYEYFRIQDNFNLPVPTARTAKDQAQLKGMRSSTQWATAMDLKNRVLYWHTMHNRRVRKIDLKKIDFGKLKKDLTFLPLDEKQVQDIKEVTVQ